MEEEGQDRPVEQGVKVPLLLHLVDPGQEEHRGGHSPHRGYPGSASGPRVGQGPEQSVSQPHHRGFVGLCNDLVAKLEGGGHSHVARSDVRLVGREGR